MAVSSKAGVNARSTEAEASNLAFEQTGCINGTPAYTADQTVDVFDSSGNITGTKIIRFYNLR